MRQRSFWTFLVTAAIMGCERSPSTGSETSGEAEDAQGRLRWVMVKKDQCHLRGDARETAMKDITGTWMDSLIWLNRAPDTCWYGAKCLDRRIRLELKISRIFIWSERYRDGAYDRTDKGEFFLSNDSSGTTLVLAHNTSTDTLFTEGDLMHGREFKLYWVDGKRILLVPPVSDAEEDVPAEVYELVREQGPQ